MIIFILIKPKKPNGIEYKDKFIILSNKKENLEIKKPEFFYAENLYF